MISNETPQGLHNSALNSVLHRLSIASQGPLEQSRGKIEKALDPFEAKIKRMTRGVHTFKAEWENHTDRANIINNIVESHKIFIEVQAQFTANSAVWDDYRSEKELGTLDREIRKTRLDEKLKEYENSPEHEKSQTIMKNLEQEKKRAQTAQKTIEREHLTQMELSEQELALDEAKERYQTQLCGFLFARNKEIFLEKKSASAFSSSKEDRQIEGVARALNGEHLHMGTGEGKSTAVLPIASLVEAVTNGDNRVIIGSANSILIEELKENTLQMSEVLSELSPYNNGKENIINGHDVYSSERTVDKTFQKNLTARKNKETITTGTIESSTLEDQKKRYWESFVRGKNAGEGENLAFLKTPSGTVELYFADEKELVWQWMENKEAFAKGCPTILMDEAHVPFDQNKHYSRTSSAEALSETDIQTGIADWLVHYVAAEEMRRMYMDKSLFADNGGYELTDEARNRIREIDIDAISSESRKSYAESFYKGIGVIADHFNINDIQERSELGQRLLSDLKKYSSNNETISLLSDQSETPDGKGEYGTKDLFEAAGEQVAKYMRLQGKDFLEKNGKVTIRDSYVDELLEEHKYNPDVQVAVLAVAGVFEPVKREVAFKTTTYPSFVHALKDKFIGFSGTLMYPDARKNKMKKGPFASFLENATKRSVHMVETPEIKQFPKPHIHKSREEMYEILSNDLATEREFDQKAGLKEGRPTLLVDFNGLESAVDSFNEMKKIYGESRVRLLLSKPTGGDKQAEIDYKNQLDEYRRQLSDGEIDVLVSSGSAALGVNFEKGDGLFPDLRTVMVGMPDSEQRIAQTIGRRRLPENATRNHLWYMNTDDLELQLSLFENQTKKHYIGFKKSRQQMVKALMQDKNDPAKTLNHVLDIMSRMRSGRAVDTDFQISYDVLVDSVVMPYAASRMKSKIAKELLKYDQATIDTILKYDDLMKKGLVRDVQDADLRLKKRILDEHFNSMGLPSTLHSDILKSEWIAPIANKEAFGAHYVSEQPLIRMNNLRKHIFDNSGAGFNLDAYLDEWFDGGKEAVEKFTQSIELENKLSEINDIEPGRNWVYAYTAPLFEHVDILNMGVVANTDSVKYEKKLVLVKGDKRPRVLIVGTLKDPRVKDQKIVLSDPVTNQHLDLTDIMGLASPDVKLYASTITYAMPFADVGEDYVAQEGVPVPMKDFDVPLLVLSVK